MRSFGFFLKETIEGIRQHSTGSLVTFLQVFISLFFLGMSLLVITNINHVVDGLLNNLEIRAFLADDLSIDETPALMDKIKEMSGIVDVKYISKEEAFVIMQERTTIDISDLVQTNPLPASLEITIENPSVAGEQAAQVSEFAGVEDVRYAEDELEKLLPALYGAELFSFLLAILIAIVTMMTIANTIRLAIHARRKEIKIMQLVGAAAWFVRIPFMLEGFIYGIIGAVIAVVVVGIVYSLILVIYSMRNLYNPFMLDFDVMMGNVGLMLLVLGGFIGTIASLIAVGKHLEEDLYRHPVPEKVSV
ncbi:MAG TPA: permease-like cell division protein FtsX [bacterium]|jgi:cell division transport system permease protein